MARRVKPGDAAGTVNSHGYVVISIGRVKHKAHRLAWFAVHGDWPTGPIDHINGVRTDNRIANLRDTTNLINAQNRRHANKNNNSGLLGVCKATNADRYEARIRSEGSVKYLGRFETPEAAHQTYLKAKRVLHVGAVL